MQNSQEIIMLNSNSASRSNSMYATVCHHCPQDKHRKIRDAQKLAVVSVFCVIFMIAEIVGGVLSNSLAIASDAAHLLTDFSAFMVSLASIWISSKSQTRKMSFGFHRAEVLGALISILSIWLVTGILVYVAIQRILYPDYDLDALIMIYVSAGGIAANVIMAIILIYYKSSNSNISENSVNTRSALLHVIGDLLQSIGVCIGSFVIYFYPHLKVIDPICTFIFSAIVLCTTFRIMRDIFRVLMEGFPRQFDYIDVKNVLYSIPGVMKIHNMRMWSLTLDKVALTAHIVVRKGENHLDVLKNANEVISKHLHVYEVTLQVEEIDDLVGACSICS